MSARKPANDLRLFSLTRFLHRPRRLARRFLHVGVRDPRTDYSVEVPFREPPALAPLRIAVVIHLFNVEMTEQFLRLVNASGMAADLLVTTDTPDKKAIIEREMRTYATGTVTVRLVANRGRDVLPKLSAFITEYKQYDLLLFLHSKKSTHLEEGADWASFLFTNLLGSSAHVRSIVAIFAANPGIGIIFPQHFERIRQYLIWNSNFPAARRLARRMGFRLHPRAPLDFISGSMFWARPAAIAPLIRLGLTAGNFPEELGQTEGTVAHAIERLYLHSAEIAGFAWLKIATSSLYCKSDTIVAVEDPDEVPTFLQQHGVRLLSRKGPR